MPSQSITQTPDTKKSREWVVFGSVYDPDRKMLLYTLLLEPVVFAFSRDFVEQRFDRSWIIQVRGTESDVHFFRQWGTAEFGYIAWDIECPELHDLEKAYIDLKSAIERATGHSKQLDQAYLLVRTRSLPYVERAIRGGLAKRWLDS